MATEPRPASVELETASDAESVIDAGGRRIYFGYYIVGAALLAQFIAVGSQASVSGVFLRPMTEDLGWSTADFTWAQTINRFLMAFAGVWIGVYVDKLGGRPVMVAGALILAGALFSVSLVEEL